MRNLLVIITQLFFKECEQKYGKQFVSDIYCATAVTVLVRAYEESRPAKKPNWPPRRGARKFLVQIKDFDNIKDILKSHHFRCLV